jgi:membrane protein required for colicin V production
MIDIVFAVILVIAVVKGLRKGLAVALFSIIAFIIGLAAALKLSAAVAVYLEKNVAMSSQWLPALSFLLVFLVVVVLVNLGGKLVEKTFEMAFLGWANRLGGAIFYVLLYSIIFSIFLFYAERMSLIKQETLNSSITYPFIKPLGPAVIKVFAQIIPLFKDSFEQLERFFEGLPDKITH